MAEIKLTKGQLAIVDDELYVYLNQWKWYLTFQGYACRSEWIKGGKGKKKEILMHRQIMGINNKNLIDHINQDKLDNRRGNLRIANKKDNVANAKLWSTNKSGHRGIYWSKQVNKWEVRINPDNKYFYGGRFNNLEDAVISRNKLYASYFGAFFNVKGGY